MNAEELRKANETAIAILELQLLGYTFDVDGGKVRYKLEGEMKDPTQAAQFFQVLKNDKEGVIRYFERIRESFDLAEVLHNAALKAYTAGDLPRFARLMAAALKTSGVDHVNWDEWVKSFGPCPIKN
jgi:hypothetical protein